LTIQEMDLNLSCMKPILTEQNNMYMRLQEVRILLILSKMDKRKLYRIASSRER